VFKDHERQTDPGAHPSGRGAQRLRSSTTAGVSADRARPGRTGDRLAAGGSLTLAAFTQSVQTYGYAAVFLAVGLESLGVPIPGETTLIAASVYAGSTHRLSLIYLTVVAAVAAIIGDNIGYLIGRVGGYRLLRRYGHYVRVDEAKLKVGRYLFDRHGGKVVFIGRFISVARTYAAFLAGVNMMSWRRFLVYNAAGGIIWAALITAGGYFLGNAVHQVSTWLSIVGGALVVVILVVLFVYFRRHFKRLEQRAERAYPGTLDDPEVASSAR
jgi:membrane protein DedA with SNARE-associated domain